MEAKTAPTEGPSPQVMKSFQDILNAYRSTRESFNALIVAPPGGGKTFSLRTARKPVVIAQFDSGGATGLQDEIDRGEVLVMDYSGEDPGNPTAFRKWEADLARLRREGFFDFVGTYALDSLTSWTNSMMLAILGRNGRMFKTGNVDLYNGKGNKAAVPELRDYGTSTVVTAQYLGMLTGLPCDFIALAHEYLERDDDDERIIGAYPLLTKRLRQEVPALFDEVYFGKTRATKDGVAYEWLTQPDRYYTARSRLSKGRLLDKLEPQDFKHILKKVGRDTADLPLIR